MRQPGGCSKPDRPSRPDRLGGLQAHRGGPPAVLAGAGDRRALADGADDGRDLVHQLVDFAGGLGDGDSSTGPSPRWSLSQNVGSNVRSIAPLHEAQTAPVGPGDLGGLVVLPARPASAR